jgi:hypothetical protein
LIGPNLKNAAIRLVKNFRVGFTINQFDWSKFEKCCNLIG